MFSSKGIFKWNVLNFFIYCIYSCPNVSFFLQSNLKKYKFLKVHIFCQILCFIFLKFHNFKSYQNMLTFSSLIFYVISYKFFLNNIYIASHLHVKRDSWTFFKPSFLINTKYKKIKIWVLFRLSNNTLLLKKKDEINCVMKIKGPLEIVSLNEVVKHPLFKPNFDIRT